MRFFSPVLTVWLLALVMPQPALSYGHADKVPTLDVSSAHIFYRSPGSEADPVLAENVLRVFALRVSDPVVDRNLAWVRRSGWQPEFKAIFERAVIWARTVRRKSPEELYRLSHELRARPDAGENFFGRVAIRLRGMAAKRGHKQAKREDAEWFRNKKSYWSPRHHAWLMNRVRDGEPGAMVSLAIRYTRGEGVENNPAKAYYWYLRAKEGGRDVALMISNLERRISRTDRDQALKWLAEGTVPKL